MTCARKNSVGDVAGPVEDEAGESRIGTDADIERRQARDVDSGTRRSRRWRQVGRHTGKTVRREIHRDAGAGGACMQVHILCERHAKRLAVVIFANA